MAIKYERSEIILTGRTVKDFINKMGKPNLEVSAKRNAYFKHINDNLKTKIVDNKKIVIQ